MRVVFSVSPRTSQSLPGWSHWISYFSAPGIAFHLMVMLVGLTVSFSRTASDFGAVLTEISFVAVEVMLPLIAVTRKK